MSTSRSPGRDSTDVPDGADHIPGRAGERGRGRRDLEHAGTRGVRRGSPAALRVVPADRGQQRSGHRHDPGQRRCRATSLASGLRLQVSVLNLFERAGLGHSVLLRVASSGGAGGRRRRRALPSGRATTDPRHAGVGDEPGARPSNMARIRAAKSSGVKSFLSERRRPPFHSRAALLFAVGLLRGRRGAVAANPHAVLRAKGRARPDQNDVRSALAPCRRRTPLAWFEVA